MFFNYGFLLLTLLCLMLLCLAKDETDFENIESLELSRTTKDDLKQNEWKKLQVPQDYSIQTSTEFNLEMTNPPTVKRRKLRKRKRRPQKTSFVDLQSENYEMNRYRRPQRLDEIDQIWDVMDLEQINKPYSRRRLTPDYTPAEKPERSTELTTSKFEEIRDPYKALEEVGGKLKKWSDDQINAPDLKTVLKKTEGTLSLSEILQQKNLTLSDLLKGGSKAISALKQATDVKNKTNNKNNKTQESLLENVDTETEIRNFMLSDHKNFERNSLTTNKMVIDVTETTTNSIDVSERNLKKYDNMLAYEKLKSKLPITSAKLHKFNRKMPQTTQKSLIDKADIPPKAFQINLNDIFGFSEILPKNSKEKDTDEPLKMILNLENISNENYTSTLPATNYTTLATSTIHNLTITTSTIMPLQDKLKIKTAKEEILEFINDKANKENISQILESRNMTLEELIELRERGSSQRHLLDIFQNKTDNDGIKDEPYIEKVQNFFQFTSMKTGRRPKSHNIEINEEKEVPSTNKYSVTSFPVYKIDVKNPNQNRIQMPYWKSIYPNVAETFQDHNNDVLINDNVRENFERDDYDNKINSVVNDKLNIEINENLNYGEDEEYFNWPAGVKSALFASLVIIGASLMIFLSILIIFKWSQKTKRKLCYRNTFSESKIKSTILNDEPKRTIRTIMCETLGKKKNHWKTKQSMSDTIWDSNRIPFQ